METHEIWQAFMSEKCAGCGGHKKPHNAFCVLCYRQLPKLMQHSLWKRFGDGGFEQAYQGSLSWFRLHPLQGVHRARQKHLFEDAS
jgi:hypothetical protein